VSVIAFRDGTMAADRQGTFRGCVPVPSSKVFEHKGVLYGSSGGIEDFIAFRDWMKAGADPRDRPELEDVSFLRVDHDGIAILSERLIPIPLNMPFWAIGGGADYAMGAMAAGMSAERAVLVACQFHTGCGLGVETLRLPRRRKER
jgi:hypothetical protein